jgi:hypothetical protein
MEKREQMRTTPTRWCPSSLAKLVNITPITMVYGRYNELVNGVYKPTYNWGAPSCTFNDFNGKR